MRHLWGFVSAIGLIVVVVFGTWGCLASATDDAGAPTSLLMAVGGGVALIVGIVARGDGSGALAKGLRIIGGIGLVVAPVAGFLTLLALGTDPSAAIVFLLVTVAALGAWALGISAQVGLSVRVSFAWLVTMAAFVATAIVVGAAFVSILVDVLSWDSSTGTRLAFGLVLALIVGGLGVWGSGRPDRQAVPGAVHRAALGRSQPGDVELLAAGPLPILRRRPSAAQDLAAADTRLLAADARLAGIEMSPKADGGGESDSSGDGHPPG